MAYAGEWYILELSAILSKFLLAFQRHVHFFNLLLYFLLFLVLVRLYTVFTNGHTT